MKKVFYLILPTTAILGSALPGIGKLFAFRLLVLLFFLGTLFKSRMSFRGIKTISRFRLLTVVWMIVGVTGLTAVIDLSAGLDALAGIAVGLMLANAVLVTKDPEDDLAFLERGWVIAFLLSSVFGVRELLTGQHLANYFGGTSLTKLDTSLASSFFENSSLYAVFLIIMVPILAKKLTDVTSKGAIIFYGSLNILGIVLLLATGSRLCLLAMLLQFAVLFRWASPLFRRRMTSSLLVAALAGVMLSGVATLVAEKLPGKLATAAPSKMWAEITTGGRSSGGDRLSTDKDGLWMTVETHGLGVGPGNFQAVMISGDVPYKTYVEVDPHNAYLEILSEYGIAVFVLFMFWVASCFSVARHAVSRHDPRTGSWGVTVVAMLVGTSLSATASSTYFTVSFNWMAIATVVLAVANLERQAIQSDKFEFSSASKIAVSEAAVGDPRRLGWGRSGRCSRDGWRPG